MFSVAWELSLEIASQPGVGEAVTFSWKGEDP